MLDCIEIDGASNNGVENVRDLIEKARFEPNIGAYKIYIIDEVHMLSTGAFNALLKTLEEPPKHVKFILATTEIEKVPETIRSRSLRFDFKKISEADIVKRLEYVCEQEWINAEKEALQIIARAARGALRDALTLTEQNAVNGDISTEYVRSTLSLIEDSLIEEIISTIVQNDKEKMIAILDILRSRHAEVRGLFDQILYGLRDAMMASFQWKNTTSFVEYSDIFALFESAYGRIKSIPDGWLLIEITLLRAVARGEKAVNNSISLWWVEWTQRGLGEGTVWVRWKKDTKNIQISEGKEIRSTRDDKTTEKQKSTDTKKIEDPEINSEWQAKKEEKAETPSSTFNYIRLLEAIKNTKATLVLDLKTARFEQSDTNLTLIFSKWWHHTRANNPAMRTLISETLETLYGGTWNILCRLEWTPGANIADEIF